MALLTSLTVRNFKRFESAQIELGNPVVFIGPNNSGKTTALQALALWDVGLKRWLERRGKSRSEKRPGVTINRRDVLALPVSNANLLWRHLRVREGIRVDGKQQTKNIRIDIVVEGIAGGASWRCGLEFDYANEESFYVRPLRLSEEPEIERMPVPEHAANVNMAYLPPMSGLGTNETRLDVGAINVRLGEGRTAEVLRNLCYQVAYADNNNGHENWEKITAKVEKLFGVVINRPEYNQERGEITMTYRDSSATRLDLASAGRGLQQTLLLLTHMTVNPNSVILIDEPDAHLEIIRQREVYQLLSDTAREHGSQLIAASHSEVVLNEAADRDVVVAFLGAPHRIDDRGSQLLKALKDIGFDQFYQAEQVGWVLYLEGSTDFAILRAFAEKLAHPATSFLERPFVHYVQNHPQQARHHFHGLREAKKDLVGFALFDRINDTVKDAAGLTERQWNRKEIENYLCQRVTLLSWARESGEVIGAGPLFSAHWERAMADAIDEIEGAMQKLRKGSPWEADTKVSDDFLDPLFKTFFEKISLPNLMQKSDYHQLARHVPQNLVDEEVASMLDIIVNVAESANPVR